MTTKDIFLAHLAANPNDAVAMGALADYLDESGESDEAAEWRFMSGTKRDIGLPKLFDDYDWGNVFGDASSGKCDDKTDACPPGAPVDCTPPKRTDVVKVIAAANGENDGPDWVGVFKLKDGRFLLASGGCDFTGWD